MATRTWTLKIRGDEKDALRAASKVENKFKSLELNKGLKGQLDKMHDRFGKFASGMASTGRKLAKGLAIGIGGGLLALGAVAAKAFHGFEVHRKTMALTTQVIKTMGAKSWVSAKGVEALSDRLERLTGIDGDIIQHGANVVLTFKNIRNEAGKGNDIFSRTVTIANDMSVALGQDMKSSSIQLGKALNDPIKGLNALRRVGVAFTQQQQDQIAKMVKNGNLLGAQKIILDELGTEFGGAAKAAASPWSRLRAIFFQVADALGEKIFPVVLKVSTLLADKLPAALARGKVVLNAFLSALRGEGVTSDGLVGMAERLGVAVRAAWPHVQRIAEAVKGFAMRVAEFFKRNPKVLFATLATVIGTLLVGAVLALAAAAIAVVSPFIAVVAVLGLVAGAVTYAYTRWGWFRDAVDAVVSWFKTTALPRLQDFATAVRDAFDKVVSWVRTNWPKVQAAVGVVVEWFRSTAWPALQTFARQVQEKFQGFIDWTKRTWPQVSEAIGHVLAVVKVIVGVFVVAALALWRTFGDTLLTFARNIWNAIWRVIQGVLTIIRGIIQTVLALINGDWGKAWDGIKLILSGAWGVMRGIVEGGLAVLLGVVSLGLDAIQGVWNLVWAGMSGALGGIWRGIKNGVTAGVNAVIKVINWFIRLINHIPGVNIDEIGLVGGGGGKPDVPTGNQEHGMRRARGGMITKGPQYLVGEGNRFHPEAVIATDPRYRKRNRALLGWAAQKLGMGGGAGQGYAKGGVPGYALGGIPNPVNVLKGAAEAAGGFARDLSTRALGPVRDTAKRMIDGIPGGDATKFVRDFGKGVVDRMYNWARGKTDEHEAASGGPGANAGYGGGSVERWRSTALRALSMTGSPASWIGSLLRRMNQESGGNPNAVNLWDSNARRGDPSGGLMQNIRSAYAGRVSGFPSLRGTSFLNPLGSIVASIVYANARYGSAPRGWDRAGGYRNGGIVDRPGPTHPGEMVLRPGDQRQLLKVVRSRAPEGGRALVWSGDVIVYANTPAEGRASGRAFEGYLIERGIIMDARIP